MDILNPGKTPAVHRAYRGAFFKWLGKSLFRRMGWQLQGEFPEDRQLIIVVAPHTSNWDFVVGMSVLWGMDLRCRWLGKDSLFRPPCGWLMRRMGGTAVNRENPGSIAADLAQEINQSGGLALVITPEGTRGRVEKWKTGFLRIARASNSRILLAALDFEKKTAYLGDVVSPAEDEAAQIAELKAYFSQFHPKNPGNY